MAQGEEELEKPRGNPWLAFDTRGGIFVWSVILLVFPFAAYGPIGALLEDETQVRAFLQASASFTGAPRNHPNTLPYFPPVQSAGLSSTWRVLIVSRYLVRPAPHSLQPLARAARSACQHVSANRSSAATSPAPPCLTRLVPVHPARPKFFFVLGGATARPLTSQLEDGACTEVPR